MTIISDIADSHWDVSSCHWLCQRMVVRDVWEPAENVVEEMAIGFCIGLAVTAVACVLFRAVQ
jgi:hypothetical protein